MYEPTFVDIMFNRLLQKLKTIFLRIIYPKPTRSTTLWLRAKLIQFSQSNCIRAVIQGIWRHNLVSPRCWLWAIHHCNLIEAYHFLWDQLDAADNKRYSCFQLLKTPSMALTSVFYWLCVKWSALFRNCRYANATQFFLRHLLDRSFMYTINQEKPLRRT